MGRKKVLEKRLSRLQKRKAALVAKSKEDGRTADELRGILAQIDDINEDIEDVQDELDAIAEGEGSEGGEGGEGSEGNDPEPQARGGVIPPNAQLRGGIPMNSYVQNPNPTQQRSDSVLDSLEYRNAFVNYLKTGDTSGFEALESRAAETLITSDVGKIIPNTIMNEFIKELKVYGNLYNRVRKLNVKGGVEFPIEELVPTVKWITETTVSETQKAPQIKTSISFGYHICEARISQSLLSQVVTLSVLESEIAKLLAEAFVKEFDNMIVNGSGSGQPTGILNDTRIPSGQKIKFTAAELGDWTNWRKKLFGIIPLAYRGQGVLIMTANTWENYIMTLKDTNNRPLYNETYDPMNGNLTCRFAGREVILVEPDILKDFDTAGNGEAWAIYMKPTNYAINSNLQIGFKRWFDDNNNKYINKGLCILDGKLLDVNGVYILTK